MHIPGVTRGQRSYTMGFAGKDASIQKVEGSGLTGTEEVAETFGPLPPFSTEHVGSLLCAWQCELSNSLRKVALAAEDATKVGCTIS